MTPFTPSETDAPFQCGSARCDLGVVSIDSLIAGRLTITVPEAGAMLGLGRGAAYAAARRGEIPTLRFAARLVVPVPALLELVGFALPTDGHQHASESAA